MPIEPSKSTGETRATPLGPVAQVGIVVDDIVTATERYGRVLGVTDWMRYTYGPAVLTDQQYRGEPAAFSMHIALGGQQPQIELIEPAEGPSIYDEHLERFGPSMHHLGVYVDSLDDAIDRMARSGYAVLQKGTGFGLDGDGGFAYFDTAADLHTIVEAIVLPRRRRPPLATWRSAPGS